jgi:hypothetical protein
MLCEVTGFEVLTAGVYLGFETEFSVYLWVTSSVFSSKTSLSAYELHDSKVLPTLYVIVKVKQSLYRSIRDPEGSQISTQSAYEGAKFVRPTQQPTLPAREYSWYSFLLEAVSNPRPKSGRKILKTSNPRPSRL